MATPGSRKARCRSRRAGHPIAQAGGCRADERKTRRCAQPEPHPARSSARRKQAPPAGNPKSPCTSATQVTQDRPIPPPNPSSQRTPPHFISLSYCPHLKVHPHFGHTPNLPLSSLGPILPDRRVTSLTISSPFCVVTLYSRLYRHLQTLSYSHCHTSCPPQNPYNGNNNSYRDNLLIVHYISLYPWA